MSQRTPLFDVHVRAGARMVEFAGWEMPVQYAGLLEEHEAVRTRAGLFDVSHMGEVVFRGPRALEALNRLFTNDLSQDRGRAGAVRLPLPRDRRHRRRRGRLPPRRRRPARLRERREPAEGLRVARRPRRRRGRAERVRRLGAARAAGPARGAAPPAAHRRSTSRRSDSTASATATSPACPASSPAPATPARTASSSSAGPRPRPRLWDALIEAGKPEGIQPAGLGARDTLRLEMAYRLYGSRHGRRHDAARGGPGLGREARQGRLHRARRAACARRSRASRASWSASSSPSAGIARHGYPVRAGRAEGRRGDERDAQPSLKTSIGLAYVPPALAAEGSTFAVEIRGRPAAAKVVKTPFYTRK